MKMTTARRSSQDDKDEIIKRQALEIASLTGQILNNETVIADAVNARMSEMFVENKDVIEENAELRKILENVIKSLRVLCKDHPERLKFIHSMQLLDEGWYLSTYDDVANGYPRGALDHYCKFGIFENRKPNRFL